MKKILIVFVVLSVLMVSTLSFAETRGGVILKDTAYGALTGAIIGTAALAFTEEPKDHLNYITYGAATGAIVGALFGVYEATALVEFDNSKKKVKVAVPTVINSVKGKEVVSSVNLLKVRY